MSILGTSASQEQPQRVGWSPSRGPYTIRSWKGGRAAIDTLFSQCISAGYSVERSGGQGGIWTLEATIGQDVSGDGRTTGSEIVDDWELLPNKAQKDLLSSDVASVNALTADELDQVRHYIQTAPPPGTSPAFTNPSAQLPVYDLMKAGVEHKVVHQPILRHTWVVPQNSRKAFNFTTVDKVITTATMFSTEGVPSDFLLPLKSLPTKYSNPTRTDGIALVYGWYKAMPTLTLSAYGRRLIQAEYEFGLWSTLIYGAAV